MIEWSEVEDLARGSVAYGLAWPHEDYLIALGASLSIDGIAEDKAVIRDAGGEWTLAGLGSHHDVTLLDAGYHEPAGLVVVGTSFPFRMDPVRGLLGHATGVAYALTESAGWQAAPAQDSLVGADFRGILVTGDRFVAFGGFAEGQTGGCSWGCLHGAGIWTSGDGLTWTARLREAGPDPELGFLELRGVVEGPDGLLALGVRYSDAFVPQTVLWASEDGNEWRAIESSGLEDVPLGDIVAVGDGYVGIADASGVPALFDSPDGLVWQPIPGESPRLDGLIVVEDGFVGWRNAHFDATEPTPGGIWTSRDGITWTGFPGWPCECDGFYISALASRGRVIVGSGSNSEPVSLREGVISFGVPG